MHQRPLTAPLVLIVAATAFVGLSALQASGQSADGHAGHHPDAMPAPSMSAPASPAAPPGNPPTGVPGSPSAMPGMPSQGGAMGGMMGGMGEMMGGSPQKEFYPSLMDLPTLSPEQRHTIEAQARARISAGTDEIAIAGNALRHANASGDAAGAEQAARRLRDGLNQVDSGTAALRALMEGKSPSQIAQDWFKGQLNLSTAMPVHASEGPFGLSWLHVMTMGLGSAFAIAMLAIYFARMRRANALVDRLSSVTLAPMIPATPPSAATTAPQPSLPGAAPAAVVTSPAATPSGSLTAAAGPVPTGTLGRPGLWKGQLRVAAIFDETPNVKTFRLRSPQGGPIPFTFVPGHFLTYSAQIDGKLVRRSYTIASSAAQTAYVETTIKREEQGLLSRYMHDNVAVGDLVDVMGPSGVFTFSGTEAESVVLIGGGVGITPLMAAIRYLNDIAWPGEIFLVYGARSTADFIFRDELEHLQRRHPNLHVIATMARAAGTSWMGPEGPITKELLAQAVPEIAKRRVHLCGPPGMMEAMKKLLAELGVPGDQIKTEAFGPAKGAVPPPGVTVTEPIQLQPDGSAGPAAALPAAIGPATASIRFAKSNKVVPLPPDQSVLEVAEAADVPIDYSCRVGTCGICKTRLLEGQVTMEVEEALTPEDKAQNIILACQAKSIGNLVVDA
ncbi:2Fe-2S iron-sulfur cluster binding domain-containing protein [Microvirga sp. BT325]|uniref:2Fe-2S iron-sulfur cluster binding domain-containing protein n=2 Tax=Microvirga splendida TaxID=2795727 RepID=A0ABS0Y4J0_9HYPH|nr:2Fe-2S iron-sulfur cluster binding domain-containing protein [Microvirga splendida]